MTEVASHQSPAPVGTPKSGTPAVSEVASTVRLSSTIEQRLCELEGKVDKISVRRVRKPSPRKKSKLSKEVGCVSGRVELLEEKMNQASKTENRLRQEIAQLKGQKQPNNFMKSVSWITTPAQSPPPPKVTPRASVLPHADANIFDPPSCPNEAHQYASRFIDPQQQQQQQRLKPGSKVWALWEPQQGGWPGDKGGWYAARLTAIDPTTCTVDWGDGLTHRLHRNRVRPCSEPPTDHLKWVWYIEQLHHVIKDLRDWGSGILHEKEKIEAKYNQAKWALEYEKEVSKNKTELSRIALPPPALHEMYQLRAEKKLTRTMACQTPRSAMSFVDVRTSRKVTFETAYQTGLLSSIEGIFSSNVSTISVEIQRDSTSIHIPGYPHGIFIPRHDIPKILSRLRELAEASAVTHDIPPLFGKQPITFRA